MAEETRTFEEVKAEQDALWAEIDAKPEPEGYDAWFRAEVALAVEESEDPNAVTYSADEVNEMMCQRRRERDAALLRRAS